MTNGIFVTENKRLDYQGSAIVKSILTGDIYEKNFTNIQKNGQIFIGKNWI